MKLLSMLCALLQRKTEVHNLWLKESSQFMTKRVTIDFLLPPLYPRPAGRGGAERGWEVAGGRGVELCELCLLSAMT